MAMTNQSPYKIGADSYDINTHNNKFSCFTDILDAIHGQMQAMLSHHNKVIVVRVICTVKNTYLATVSYLGSCVRSENGSTANTNASALATYGYVSRSVQRASIIM